MGEKALTDFGKEEDMMKEQDMVQADMPKAAKGRRRRRLKVNKGKLLCIIGGALVTLLTAVLLGTLLLIFDVSLIRLSVSALTPMTSFAGDIRNWAEENEILAPLEALSEVVVPMVDAVKDAFNRISVNLLINASDSINPWPLVKLFSVFTWELWLLTLIVMVVTSDMIGM